MTEDDVIKVMFLPVEAARGKHWAIRVAAIAVFVPWFPVTLVLCGLPALWRDLR